MAPQVAALFAKKGGDFRKDKGKRLRSLEMLLILPKAF